MSLTPGWKRYILWFATEHVDFRIAEIQSIFKVFDFGPKITSQVDQNNENLNRPFWILDLPSDDYAAKIASRSVLLRSVVELWTHANNFNGFHVSLAKFLAEHKAQKQHLFEEKVSFRVTVETYNKHFTQQEKVAKIETIGYLPSKGPVDLNNPDTNFFYIEYYGMDPNNVPDSPFDILFGHLLYNGQRRMLHDISLKTRKFIGNTSMDPQLSVLMSNQGLARKGCWILDPFVGSGSLLVPAAKFGAYVSGSDLDRQMLHGKSKPTRVHQKMRASDESILANLKQYNCEQLYVDILVSDFSLPIWHAHLQFDAIITDPPYGIREATEKIVAKSGRKSTVLAEDTVHYPSTSPYQLNHLFFDLMVFGAKHLRLGGRLVFWFPVYLEEYSDDLLPKHKCMQLIANSENPLSSFSSRRLLTYEKVSDNYELTEEERKEFVNLQNFRERYFCHQEETRTERRTKSALLREFGRQEALKRGKILKDK